MSGTLVFVTDYGLADGYAAQLWAAAWSAAPGLRCVDGTHLVPPGDVITGAYRCKVLAGAFGPGSVICAVVDPGVGGHREAVAVECDGVRCVAPDTGLVSYLWTEARQRYAVLLPTPAGVSPTFHGRDFFAPLAALLASGTPLSGCGRPVAAPQLRDELSPSSTATACTPWWSPSTISATASPGCGPPTSAGANRPGCAGPAAAPAGW